MGVIEGDIEVFVHQTGQSSWLLSGAVFLNLVLTRGKEGFAGPDPERETLVKIIHEFNVLNLVCFHHMLTNNIALNLISPFNNL